MDDENYLNWNLKGPKKMKKRKELNALLKDKSKSKSKSNSMIELFKRASSSDRDDNFYFSGNKSMIRKYIKQKKCYFSEKYFQLIF